MAKEIFIDIYAGLQGLIQESYLPGTVEHREHFDEQQILKNIPKEILVLFVEEFLSHYRAYPQNTLQERLYFAAGHVGLTEKVVHMGSMFSDTTFMFSDENTQKLSPESLAYLGTEASRKQCGKFLGDLILKNIVRFSKGYTESTYFSDFSEINNGESQLPQAHVSFSIRSLSHVSGPIYESFLEKHMISLTESGGVFFDDGVSESYTRHLRLYEMARVEAKYPDHLKFRLVYDPKTHKVKSAIIERAAKEGETFRDQNFWEEEISPEYELKSISEILAMPRFKLEIAIREFLMTNFRTHDVFKAIEPLFEAFVERMLAFRDMPDSKTSCVLSLLLATNATVEYMNQRNDTRPYEPIELASLLKYRTSSGETIDEFLDTFLSGEA